MEQHLEIVNLDSSMRIVVDVDQQPVNPRDEEDCVRMLRINTNKDYHPFVAPEPDPVWYALESMAALFDVMKSDEQEEDFVDHARKYLNKIGINSVIRTFYSGRDWLGTYLMYGEDASVTVENIKDYAKQLDKYSNGDVYTLTLQKRVEWTTTDADIMPKLLVTWEDLECVHDAYLDRFDDKEELVGCFQGLSIKDGVDVNV
jgi:hypothetical protein